MSPTIVVPSTLDLDDATLQELRRTSGIGASEAAACAGIDPWTSPISLVLRKLGQLQPQPQNDAMYWGHVLEPVVADEFARRHPDLRVRRRNAMLRSAEHQFMVCNLDREVDGTGAVEPLECKTASAWMVDEWDSPPDHYVLQVQHQLVVREAAAGWLAVLIGGRDYREWRIERDTELVELLVDIERITWQHVLDGTLPEPDGHDATTAALNEIFGRSIPEEVELGPAGATAIADYDDAQVRLSTAEDDKADAGNRIRYLLGEHEVGLVLGEKAVTWKRNKRLDLDAIRVARPDDVAAHTSERVDITALRKALGSRVAKTFEIDGEGDRVLRRTGRKS